MNRKCSYGALSVHKTARTAQEKSVEGLGVGDQDVVAGRLVGGEESEHIDQVAVVGHVTDVRVGPVGSPEDPVGGGRDQGLGVGDHVVVRGRAVGSQPLCTRDLDPAALVGHQLEQLLEGLLVEPGRGVDPGHVVDHVGRRHAVEQIGVVREVPGVEVQHYVPAEGHHPVDDPPEHVEVGCAPQMGHEVEPRSPDPGVRGARRGRGR